MNDLRLNDLRFVDLDKIDPNPYQQTDIEDPDKIAELAESLELNMDNGANGLLQVPTARMNGGQRVQLAFGHTRKAAFALLASQGKKVFGKMPLIIRELTDLQMFELLAIENFKRREPNPIEKARTIHTYMTTFGKTSVDAGKFFNMTDEAVRGSIRLLNLPEKAQEKVRSGEINITAARALLTLDRVAGAETIDDVLQQIDDGRPPIDVISSAFDISPEMKFLDPTSGWYKGKIAPKFLDKVTKNSVLGALGIEKKGKLPDQFPQLMQYVDAGMEIADETFTQFKADQLERVRILSNPPPCEKCQLHAAYDGSHYCGFTTCFDRKFEAWERKADEEIAKQVGIALYDKADGESVELEYHKDSDKKLFKEQHRDLRITRTGRILWMNFDGVGRNHKILAVGELAQKKKKSAEAERERGEIENLNRNQQNEIREVRQAYFYRFHWNAAAHEFASMLDGVSSLEFLLDLYDAKFQWEMDECLPEDADAENLIREIRAGKKTDGLKTMRRLLAAGILTDKIAPGKIFDAKKPLVEAGKQYQAIADEWGVKLPKNWMEQAEKYQTDFEAACKQLAREKK